MEQQGPGFELPEAANRMTARDIETLLPRAENDPPIFSGLKRVFLENARDVKVPRRQPARKAPQAKRK